MLEEKQNTIPMPGCPLAAVCEQFADLFVLALVPPIRRPYDRGVPTLVDPARISLVYDRTEGYYLRIRLLFYEREQLIAGGATS